MAEEMDKTVDECELVVVQEEEKDCHSKRKSDEPSIDPDSPISYVDDDFPPYEFSIPPSFNDIDSFELGFDYETQEDDLNEVEDWSDPMATQLEELLMANLDAIFSNAIKKVVESGYTQERVETAISRKAIYSEGDPLTNIVYHTINVLKGKGNDSTFDVAFQNVKQLLHYTMVEMIGILCELRPSLTVTEAMWELLIHDLSIPRAIAAHDKLSDDVSKGESSANSAVPPSKSEVKSCDKTPDCSSSTSQKSSQECKSGRNSKVNSRKELALALRQKFLHMEKTKACGKGGVKLGKLTAVGGLIVEKRLKPPSETPNQKMKRGSSNAKGVKIAEGVCHVLTNDSSVLTKGGSATKLPRKDAMSTSSTGKTTKAKHKLCSPDIQKIHDYRAGIPFDEVSGTYVPRDEKEEQILKLVSRVQELQDELQSWSDWTNKKVMQVADKLRKLQAESKSLKKETEAYRKDRKTLEENTEKRISEMENAIDTTKKQLESAAAATLVLQEKKSLLKKELDAAKSWAVKSMASHQEALEREQIAVKQAQSWETEKALLRDELENEKQKLCNLQEEIDKGKDHLAYAEGRLKKERATTESILAQAASIRKEREQYEELAKSEEDALRKKAASDLQEYVQSMVKIEKEMAMLRLKCDSKKATPSVKEDKESETLTMGSCQVVGSSQNQPAGESLRREQECVMCLSEERSVVFLPCAHQVLCPKCNDCHEKQGMKDCPSCRTSIEFRIHAKFLGH